MNYSYRNPKTIPKIARDYVKSWMPVNKSRGPSHPLSMQQLPDSGEIRSKPLQHGELEGYDS